MDMMEFIKVEREFFEAMMECSGFKPYLPLVKPLRVESKPNIQIIVINTNAKG